MGRRQEMWGRQEGGGRRLTAEGSDALAVTQAQETTRQRSGRGGVGGKRGGGQGPPRHGCRLSRGDTQISLCKHSGEVGGVKLHTCLVCVAATPYPPPPRRSTPPHVPLCRPSDPTSGRRPGSGEPTSFLACTVVCKGGSSIAHLSCEATTGQTGLPGGVRAASWRHPRARPRLDPPAGERPPIALVNRIRGGRACLLTRVYGPRRHLQGQRVRTAMLKGRERRI